MTEKCFLEKLCEEFTKRFGMNLVEIPMAGMKCSVALEDEDGRFSGEQSKWIKSAMFGYYGMGKSFHEIFGTE